MAGFTAGQRTSGSDAGKGEIEARGERLEARGWSEGDGSQESGAGGATEGLNHRVHREPEAFGLRALRVLRGVTSGPACPLSPFLLPPSHFRISVDQCASAVPLSSSAEGLNHRVHRAPEEFGLRALRVLRGETSVPAFQISTFHSVLRTSAPLREHLRSAGVRAPGYSRAAAHRPRPQTCPDRRSRHSRRHAHDR